MSTYVMFGKYSPEAIKSISAKRTDQGMDLIKKFGGKVKSMYALLGKYDLLFVADFPDAQNALKASVALSKLTGIAFRTSEAIAVEQFDKLMAEV